MRLQQVSAWTWLIVVLLMYGLIFFFSPYVWPDAVVASNEVLTVI